MKMRASLVLALGVVVGCSPHEEPNTNGDGDTSDTSLCAAGEVLDGLGVCRSTCNVTDDCGDPALACDGTLGLCLPVVDVGCDPASCPDGETCPLDGGLDCVPVDDDGACTSDADCSLGYRCENSECVSLAGDIVATCTADNDCFLGMSCQFGVCFGCILDLQCPGGSCVLGACVVADLPPVVDCLTAQCQDGERCNPISGACEPICASDADCGEGARCAPILNQCIADFGCNEDADCLTNEPLCVAGLCVGCVSDAECKPSETCFSGTFASVCLPTFEQVNACDGVTCAADETCDPQGGTCYPSNGTCEEDADCRTGQDCNILGFCSGCAADADCRSGQRCLFGVCAPIN